ncbi:MAG: MarR family transcriptional regulator [Caulobacteraceae bacterium]|nr:MarR family transcriptional regulator [Caulobacteraceae bacterium]
MSKSPARSSGARQGFSLQFRLLYLLVVANRHRDLKIDRVLQPLALNPPRFRALMAIGLLGSCTMSELADASAVDRTTMTRTVDQLVAAELVERTTPPQDRRQVVLRLTHAGFSLARTAKEAVEALNARLLDGIDEAAQRAAHTVLERLLANAMEDGDLPHRLLLAPGIEARPDASEALRY